MIDVLTHYFNAAYPAVAIQTGDEERAREMVAAAASKAGKSLAVWSTVKGLKFYERGRPMAAHVPGMNGDAALFKVCAMWRKPDTVTVLLDPQAYPLERDPLTLRAFKDFVADGPGSGSTAVIIANAFEPHPCMDKLVTVIDHELPTESEMRALATEMAKEEKLKLPVAIEVLHALSGMTSSEAHNALALSVVQTEGFDPAVVYREKTAVVRKSGMLEIISPDPAGMGSVGGLGVLKEWVRQRKRVWTPEAVKYGLAAPKGVLLVGVQGGGKSLAAKAIGIELGIPTLRLDCGSMFGMYVGESERRTREVLKLAEAVAPCNLWIDELDKGTAGMRAGDRSGDSGAARRVFQTLITWMQERKPGVFISATANNAELLPPELMRKGRFDEIFVVDLPGDGDRAAIFRIHLARRRRDPKAFNVNQLVDLSTGYTGAEIEAAIDDGMFRAFNDKGREVATDDIMAALVDTNPISVTASEQVEAIRAWGKARGKQASNPDVEGGLQ